MANSFTHVETSIHVHVRHLLALEWHRSFQAIATVCWPILVLKETTSLADATLSGLTVGAPIALAMASERPWSTAAKTETATTSTAVRI